MLQRILLALTVALLASEARAAEPSIALLSKDEAAIAILEEKIEPYFKLLTPLDMAAKLRAMPEGDTLEAKREDFKKKYAAHTLDFTDDEKAFIRACIELVHPVLEKHYPLVARTPWSIIKKSDLLEGGAHFTREGHIVLSQQVLVRAIRFKNDGNDDAATFTLLPLLLHEQFHVLQRLHAKTFADLYVNVWGYVHVPTLAAGDWLDARQMVNPDGVDVNWLLPIEDELLGEAGAKKLVWPRIVLSRTQGVPVMFRDMQMVLVEVTRTGEDHAVKLDAQGLPVMSPLMDSKAFNAKFPHGNSYHPNETAAAVLPAVILADLLPEYEDRKPANRKAVEKTAREWMRANLK